MLYHCFQRFLVIQNKAIFVRFIFIKSAYRIYKIPDAVRMEIYVVYFLLPLAVCVYLGVSTFSCLNNDFRT